MADETVVEDTPVAALDPNTTGQASPSKEDTGDQTDLIFGKYSNMEEATKAYEEQQTLMGKQGNEVGQMRKEMEALKSQADQAGAIKELVTALKPAEPAGPDFAAVEKGLVDEYGEEVGPAVAKSLKIASGWMEQVEGNMTKARQTEIDAIRSEIANLSRSQTQASPEYLENKETVDELVELGMPMAKAIAYAKHNSDKAAPNAPDRAALPSAGGSGRVTTTQTVPDVYLSPEERAEYKARGTTDDELDQMEAEYQVRKEAANAS